METYIMCETKEDGQRLTKFIAAPKDVKQLRKAIKAMGKLHRFTVVEEEKIISTSLQEVVRDTFNADELAYASRHLLDQEFEQIRIDHKASVDAMLALHPSHVKPATLPCKNQSETASKPSKKGSEHGTITEL